VSSALDRAQKPPRRDLHPDALRVKARATHANPRKRVLCPCAALSHVWSMGCSDAQAVNSALAAHTQGGTRRVGGGATRAASPRQGHARATDRGASLTRRRNMRGGRRHLPSRSLARLRWPCVGEELTRQIAFDGGGERRQQPVWARLARKSVQPLDILEGSVLLDAFTDEVDHPGPVRFETLGVEVEGVEVAPHLAVLRGAGHPATGDGLDLEPRRQARGLSGMEVQPLVAARLVAVQRVVPVWPDRHADTDTEEVGPLQRVLPTRCSLGVQTCSAATQGGRVLARTVSSGFSSPWIPSWPTTPR